MLHLGPATPAVATHLLHARLPNSLGRAFLNCLLSALHDGFLHLVPEASWSRVTAALAFLPYMVKHFCLSRFGFGIMWVAVGDATKAAY